MVSSRRERDETNALTLRVRWIPTFDYSNRSRFLRIPVRELHRKFLRPT
jgi:hypothetical protein